MHWHYDAGVQKQTKRTRGQIALVTLPLLLLVATAAACGAGEGDEERASTIRVVTTVSPIRNIIENVGGDRVTVTAIVPEGTNSHTFEPSPSVARDIAEADLIVANGLNLELPTLELAEANRRDSVEILLLGEATVNPEKYVYDFSFPRAGGDPNPHLWTDPMLAGEYARHVRDTLSRIDPDGAVYYASEYGRFRGAPGSAGCGHQGGGCDGAGEPAGAADLPRLVPLLRAALRVHDHRGDPALGLLRALATRGGGAGRADSGGEGAGHLRVGGVPLGGAGDDRAGGGGGAGRVAAG